MHEFDLDLEPGVGSKTGADRHFVTALARGLKVLKVFRSGEEHLGNQELARRCELPKSTVARLTYTLTKLGFLHHDRVAGRYRLGIATLTLAGTTLARLDAMELCRPMMQKLADHTGAFVGLAIRDGMSMLYIEARRSSDAAITLQMDVGSRVPIATTSLGRAWLALARPATRKALQDRIQALDPALWPRLESGIRKAMAEFEQTGYCCSFGEWHKDINAVSVPMRLGKEMPLILMCVAGPATILPPDVMKQEVCPSLLRTVAQIESRFKLRRQQESPS